MVAKGCQCPYKYGPGKPWKPSEWPNWVEQLARDVEVFLQIPSGTFNSVNANRYTAASENLNWHSDNEKLFLKSAWDRDVLIASVSFGGSRKFGIRRNNKDKVDASFLLNDGDILTMDGRLQETHKHTVFPIRLNKDDPIPEPRYNLTFRTIFKHVAVCPCRTL